MKRETARAELIDVWITKLLGLLFRLLFFILSLLY